MQFKDALHQPLPLTPPPRHLTTIISFCITLDILRTIFCMLHARHEFIIPQTANPQTAPWPAGIGARRVQHGRRRPSHSSKKVGDGVWSHVGERGICAEFVEKDWTVAKYMFGILFYFKNSNSLLPGGRRDYYQ